MGARREAALAPATTPEAAGLARWSGRAGTALLDAVLYGGASFAANLLLARYLPAAEYGVFALCFFLLLLAGAVHTALLTEPMLVFGASRYREDVRGYVAHVLAGHVVLGGALALIGGVAALGASLLDAPEFARAFAALAVSTPFVLLLWVARRIFYVTLRPWIAVAGDAVYLALVLAGIVLLVHADALTTPRALLLLGGAALVASVPLLVLARPRRSTITRSDVALEHWRFGRWNVLAQGLFWLTGQVLVVLAPLVLGIEAAASIGAVLVLFRPLHPLLDAGTLLLLPAAAARASSSGAGSVQRGLARGLFPAASLVIAYGIVVTVFAEPVLHALYRGRYDDDAVLVGLFALSYTASTIVHVLTVGLKATENVRAVPIVWLVSAVITVALSVPGMLVAGLEGGIAVMAASYAVAALVAWRAFHNSTR